MLITAISNLAMLFVFGFYSTRTSSGDKYFWDYYEINYLYIIKKHSKTAIFYKTFLLGLDIWFICDELMID